MRLTLIALTTSSLFLSFVPPAAADTVARPKAETPALFDDAAGGNANADDPAIWVNRRRPGRSLVLGTAKEGGLNVHRLDGSLAQHIDAPPAPGPQDENGRFNNVDLLGDLAVVTDRGRGTLRFYSISADRPLRDVTDPAAPLLFDDDQAGVNEQRTPYGLATWRHRGRDFALVSRRHTTTVALVEILRTRGGTYSYRLVRSIDLPGSFRLPDGKSWTPCLEPGEGPQVEGMVVDADRGVLYAAQEDVGIWKIPAALTGRPVLVDKVKEYGVPATYDAETEECTPGADPGFGGSRLAADAEGLTIYPTRSGGYLLASSQGDSTFVVYQRDGRNRFVGTFSVGSHAGIDGAQHSDGAAVVNVALGKAFPHGLLVVHDGENDPVSLDPEGQARENTNFKFVGWEQVARPLGLTIDTRR